VDPPPAEIMSPASHDNGAPSRMELPWLEASEQNAVCTTPETPMPWTPKHRVPSKQHSEGYADVVPPCVTPMSVMAPQPTRAFAEVGLPLGFNGRQSPAPTDVPPPPLGPPHVPDWPTALTREPRRRPPPPPLDPAPVPNWSAALASYPLPPPPQGFPEVVQPPLQAAPAYNAIEPELTQLQESRVSYESHQHFLTHEPPVARAPVGYTMFDNVPYAVMAVPMQPHPEEYPPQAYGFHSHGMDHFF